MSDSFQLHGLQHDRLPCPLPSPRACSNSCPSSRWCHPTISSSVVLFSSCLQSFPASGFFPMSQFFASGGQSTGASTSASVLPMNIQSWFPLRLTGLISLQSKGLSWVFSNTKFTSINSLVLSLLYGPALTLERLNIMSNVIQWLSSKGWPEAGIHSSIYSFIQMFFFFICDNT